jgi:hypothetical protein
MGYLQDQAVMNFAGTAARGSAIGTAVSQGMVSFLQDTGNIEYYANAFGTANLGGRATAGWYADTKTDGDVPVIPTAVTFVGGSGSVSSTGVVSFTNCTAIQLANVFTSKFAHYRLVFAGTRSGTSGSFITYAQLGTSASFPNTGYQGGFNGIESGFTSATNLAGGDGVYFGYVANSGFPFLTECTISNPQVNTLTSFISQTQGYSPGNATAYYYGASRTTSA